jgi:hypothetical protein
MGEGTRLKLVGTNIVNGGVAETAAIVIAIEYSPQRINAIFMLLFKSILDPAG